MDISITFAEGPVEAEIEATDEDDYVSVLDDLAEFLNEHPELEFDSEGGAEVEVEQKSEPPQQAQATLDSSVKKGESAEDVENERLRAIVEHSGVPEDKITRMFELHEDVIPRILDGEAVRGDTPGVRVLNAASAILTVWQDCYGEEWMKSGKLADALEQSPNLPDRTDYIYNQNNWKSLFNRQGEGRGTELRVTRLGKDKGLEVIQEMAEETDED